MKLRVLVPKKDLPRGKIIEVGEWIGDNYIAVVNGVGYVFPKSLVGNNPDSEYEPADDDIERLRKAIANFNAMAKKYVITIRLKPEEREGPSPKDFTDAMKEVGDAALAFIPKDK